MLALKNISKIFRTDEVETTALDQINIEIEEGEFVAVMGPSGCGKSTLLNVVGMLDNPSSGEYWFQGKDISDGSERELAEIRKRNLGFIFQSFNLIDELTVFENVELPLIYQGISKSERKKQVNEVLEKTQIAHRSGHYPQQLSGGQQQRVAVARAVVVNPAFILADEPTGNLDSKNGADVMSLLTQLNGEGTTIIMVTHSQEHADCANRTINLFDGKVVIENLREVRRA
ncbi:ABC transporter ATP-binding protein [Aliikangiella coralliicola]|uniref:ABC transporter ATP-binding protein n=1 Tax=Aliikangiella coralliicola TaxID=2592383 RepID=A0A545UIT1_9GAMM|nr:ABC transporter ATP-binding protein [Aliikangiella coralliicola]TQV89367.1 ABC transporter ATP-binding protein [Aliikangiella coralliicola]